MITDYVVEIRELRNSIRHGGMRRSKTKLITGIPPRMSPPTPYVQDAADAVDLRYWRSIAIRRDLEEKLARYLDYVPTLCVDEFAVQARSFVVDALRGKLAGRLITPLSYSAAFKAVPQDTSPGFPWSRVGIYEKRKAHGVFERLRFIEKNLFVRNFEFSPCIAQARRPLCERGENKPRLVWAFPMEVTMIEATFAVPLISLLSSLPYFAWSYNWLDGYGQYHWDNMCKGRGIKCGADWKAFDAEIHPADIKWAFDLLSEFVNFGDGRSRRRWDLMVSYFVETPLLFYDSLVLVKGGIPSGSFFTQIVGTVLNMYYTSYMFLRLSSIRTFVKYSSFDELFVYVVFLGDDSSSNVDFSGRFGDREIIASFAKDGLNKTLHPEKGFFYPYHMDDMVFEFLGKTIVNRVSILVDPPLVLAQLIYPEDPDKDPGDVLTRCIGVKWMSGTDIRAHLACDLVWEHVLGRFPDAKPTPFKKDLRDVFKFMLFMAKPLLSLPTREILLNRYICK